HRSARKADQPEPQPVPVGDRIAFDQAALRERRRQARRRRLVDPQPAAQRRHAQLAGVRYQLERLECPGHGLQAGPGIVCHRATLAGGRNTGERAAMHAGERYWRAADPRPAYEVVIVGGGGHGLATAHYLAKNHGITDVAVLERGWLAGGNMARNTTIIRSNYLWDASSAIYKHSLRLWASLEEDLGSPIM